MGSGTTAVAAFSRPQFVARRSPKEYVRDRERAAYDVPAQDQEPAKIYIYTIRQKGNGASSLIA